MLRISLSQWLWRSRWWSAWTVGPIGTVGTVAGAGAAASFAHDRQVQAVASCKREWLGHWKTWTGFRALKLQFPDIKMIYPLAKLCFWHESLPGLSSCIKSQSSNPDPKQTSSEDTVVAGQEGQNSEVSKYHLRGPNGTLLWQCRTLRKWMQDKDINAKHVINY